MDSSDRDDLVPIDRFKKRVKQEQPVWGDDVRLPGAEDHGDRPIDRELKRQIDSLTDIPVAQKG